MAFTPPGVAGRSAVGFGSPSGGGEAGDLISSGITRRHKPPARCVLKRTLTFISLNGRSQRGRGAEIVKNSVHLSSALNVIPSKVGASAANDNAVESLPLSEGEGDPFHYRGTSPIQGVPQRRRASHPRLGLILLDQTADALRIGFAVTVTGNGVGATRGFDHDLGPEDAGGNVD